jgi:peptidoglycan hydrolase-like amidase
MWKELILGVTALFNPGGDQYFHAESLSLPSGDITITTPFEWNAVTLMTTDGTTLPKIDYHVNGNTYPWYQAEDAEGGTERDLLELLTFGKAQTSLSISNPENLEVVAHFFNTIKEGENLTARFDAFDDDSFDDPETGLARKVLKPEYITRDQWGADESLRIWNPERGFRTSVPEAKNLSRTLRPKIVEQFDAQGNRLRWPLEANQTTRKFIVHHTGEVTDETRDPMELMRAIYYYHTITRGWGDIGYHYVIDKQGNIYEGRAGGAEMVGAHTALHNVGSIGISLMGNFEYEQPTPNQLKVLTLVLADHANRFKVDPSARSFWLGTNSFNVSGHRDVTREGYGTACPGRNLHALLPDIRKQATALAQSFKTTNAKSGLDFLSKSRSAPRIQRRVTESNIKVSPIVLSSLIRTKVLQRNENEYLEIKVRNQSDTVWKRGEKIYVKNIPQGTRVTNFFALAQINPGDSGTFKARILVETTPNGTYQIQLDPKLSVLKDEEDLPQFVYPIQISGDQESLSRHSNRTQVLNSNTSNNVRPNPVTALSTQKFDQPSTETYGPQVKIKLSYFDENFAIFSADEPLEVWSQGRKVSQLEKDEEVRLLPLTKVGAFDIVDSNGRLTVENPQFKTNGVITVKNYDRGLGSVPYNRFRQQINAHWTAGKNFYLVNQLALEQYLWGLSEQPNTEPTQKKHAIHVLARSYILVYSGERRKFRTQAYDLEDSPETSQMYLGYEWEAYHHEQKDLIAETKGRVITYNGEPAIGPYFTQSGGESSSKWVSQYPWTVGRKLPHDEGLEPKGHGVGLSGNTAHVLADQGKNYVEILDYFYQNIEIEKVY